MGKKSLAYQAKKELAETEIPYSKTREQYMRNITKFTDFCKREYGYKTLAECKHLECAQQYADCLSENGFSAASIHTYLAPVCRLLGVNMKEVEKPIRYVAEYKRSRGTPKVDLRADAQPSYSPRLYAFAKVVGIRRNEYKGLRGRNFKKDENGDWCVEVEKGKGGKYHLQRIAPEYVEFVRGYFSRVKPNEYVFTLDELNNKIDLHALRAAVAKEHYNRYVELFKTDETARRRVYDEICLRWKLYNGSPAPTWKEVNRPYYCRGKNREKAIANGHSYRLDRLALLAVSVFHLSHWRTDDTVCSYVMA